MSARLPCHLYLLVLRLDHKSIIYLIVGVTGFIANEMVCGHREEERGVSQYASLPCHHMYSDSDKKSLVSVSAPSLL